MIILCLRALWGLHNVVLHRKKAMWVHVDYVSLIKYLQMTWVNGTEERSQKMLLAKH